MTELVQFEKARAALIAAKTFDDVRKIKNWAEQREAWARIAKDRSLIEASVEIQRRAEIRVGEMLLEMPKNKGTKGQLKGSKSSGGRVSRPPEDPAPTLADIGITKDQSSQWQKRARQTKEEQEEWIEMQKRKAAPPPKVVSPKKSAEPKKKPLRRSGNIPEETWEALDVKAQEQGTSRAKLVGKAVETVVNGPPVDPATLSMSAQEKLATAIRQETRKLHEQYAKDVEAECQKRINETILPAYNEERALYREVIQNRRGIFDKRIYRLMYAQMHPDRGGSQELMDAFKKAEKLLLGEKDSPSLGKVPTTHDEMMAMRKPKPSEVPV